MGFRENFKAELSYADLKVKELAKLSGVKKTTLDSYLRESSYTPSVEAAVRIAGVLGVSVEYLVLGKEPQRNKSLTAPRADLRVLPGPDLRVLLQSLEKLNAEDRKIVIKNTLNLIDLLAKKNRKSGSAL